MPSESIVDKNNHNKAQQQDNNLLPLNKRELLRLGMMNNQSILISLVFAALTLANVDIGQWIQENSSNWLVDYINGRFSFMPMFIWVSIAAIVLAILSKLLDILLTFSAYGNFSLTDSEHHITLRRGLFTRIESHVPRYKIQVWRIQQGPLQRLMSRYSLHIHTAVIPGQNDNDIRGIRHLIPIADQQAMATLIERWTNNKPFEQPVVKQHRKAARRIVIGYTLRELFYGALLVVAIAFISLFSNRSALVSQSTLLYGLGLFILLIPLNIISAHKRTHYAGWAINKAQYLHWRDGFIWRKHHFCQCAHIQSLTVQHNFLDRRLGMANLYADTMGARNASTTIAYNGGQHHYHRLRKTPMSLTYLPYHHLQTLVSRLGTTTR